MFRPVKVGSLATLVTRPAALWLCFLIVPGFEARPAAAVVSSEDVPVPGGVAALAQSLAIDPVPDRSRFMSEVTRLVYETPDIRNPTAAMFLQSIRQPARFRRIERVDPRSPERVLIPLSVDAWSDTIFHRQVPREEIVTAIIADRQASLLCHGLLLLDDETLAYLAGRPSLLARLYERHAPVFAAFAGSLRIHDDRIVPPGDADAVPLWEAVLNEKVTRVERFVLDLFGTSEGRLAFLYDTIAKLDPNRRRFALGAWLPNASMRIERFRTLATVGIGGIREWNIRALPFGRASFDIAMLLARIDVAADGTPSPPASAGFWSKALGGGGLPDDARIDAAWLAEAIIGLDVRQRSERLDQVAFAQRVFSHAAESADVVFVLRSLPRHRALLLTLDRAGIRDPSTYAAVIRHAARIAPFEGRRGFVLESQLQGVLVLVAHMRAVGTLDVPAAERLLKRLSSIAVTDDGRYVGRVAGWLMTDVRPLLPAARDTEHALIAGLAGPPGNPEAAPRVTWEGQFYRLDLAAAERRRLLRVRERQERIAIDVPLQLADAARLVASEAVSADDLEALIVQLTALATDLPARTREEEADNVPAGVTIPASPHEALRKIVDEISRAMRSKEPKRAARVSDQLFDLADDMFARVLLSFAYAIYVGDPDGAVLLADDVSHRHDFGFGLRDPEMRSRVRWSIPRQDVSPNVPWHVTGSLLGLDIGLASLALRRVATDRALEAPKLTSNVRETFAASVSLMNAVELRDEERDRIAEAIDRGQQRVLEAAGAGAVDAIADALSLDARRRRELRWTQTHEATRLPLMLSLTELMTLGGERPPAVDSWGMAVLATSGCLCSRVLSPAQWALFSGRPQLGLAAAVLPDLNFHVAIMLRELGLPAPLAKVVLSAAMQDFIDEVRPTDDGDWLTLSRTARTVTRERIEDYVAAATATGPLMPDADRSLVGRQQW